MEFQKCWECVNKETCERACTEESLLCTEQDHIPEIRSERESKNKRVSGINSEEFLSTIHVEIEGCRF